VPHRCDIRSGAALVMSKEKLLVVELWGIGDLILSTPFLERVVDKYEVLLVGKPHASATLGRTYPQLKFIEWDAPWTAFRGKYWFWRWEWRTLFKVVYQLRSWRADVAVSVRKDPRDHFLMWLVRARKRVGFGVHGSEIFLTDLLSFPRDKTRHVVEDWFAIARHLAPQNGDKQLQVRLHHRSYVVHGSRNLLLRPDRPVLCLHVGARIHVRRWPENYFAELIQKLREEFNFHLLLMPDPDGYGRSLATMADEVADNLTVEQLITVIGVADLLISNDSAPAHIAAACGTPVIAIFGPTDPVRFRPWGEPEHVVIRDICPYRPCFDYCHFPEPFCLTRLHPKDVWFEIRDYVLKLIASDILPRAFLRAERGANIS
jgi:ADP-heptose:LPS heptosyltransferase